MASYKSTEVIAGLSVNIFANVALLEQTRPVAVLFLLHGRTGSAVTVEKIAEAILSYSKEQPPAARELLIATFDHRNHGSRLVSAQANDDWTARNERHAIDMYAIQTGTASDVSFLIDFLPAYLFPSGERKVEEWMVAGISLGGHSTWIALKNDPRIKIGVPIIGCPDYLSLMGPRAKLSAFSVAPPHFPPSLLDVIRKHDPSSACISSSDPSHNPFLGKQILVLVGGTDILVPWSASKRFVEELKVGSGLKKLVVDEDAGHECSPRMVRELSSFVWVYVTATKPPSIQHVVTRQKSGLLSVVSLFEQLQLACKEREEPPHGMDTEELNPVITYRHLLSSGLGVRNPLRVIGLCDMDAFYATCEQVRLNMDPSVPLVVRQWDSLIAINYPARAYGISRMDKVTSALERCPHLQVIHVATFDPAAPDAKPTYTDNPNSETHKVSLDFYRKESKKIMEVFKEVLVDAEVERASIDEGPSCPRSLSILVDGVWVIAFIDLTEPVRQHILKHFPHLSVTPAGGLDAPLPSPPREGIPLVYPPSRADSGREAGDIWSDLGTLIPLCEMARPSQGHNASVSSTKLESRDHGDDSGEGSNILTLLDSGGRSLSVEVNAVQNNEQDVNDRLSDGEGKAGGVLFNLPPDEGYPPTWHDIALSIGASLMLRMRDEVKRRHGYTTSAGVARNKFLAKLAASYKKRDNQTILRNAAIPNYLRPLPFQKIRFLGGKLGTAIAQEYDAQTVGDLLCVGIEEMQRKFGESSIWVWEVLRGIDRSEVKEKPSVTKSMGASKNLQHPITHPSEGAHWLRILAGELAFRLIEAREENAGLWPKTLVLSIRRSYEASQSRQAPFPFTRAVTTDYICKAAEKLWVELVGTGLEYDRRKASGYVSRMKITNVFLGFSGVEAMAAGQRNIEGFLSPSGKKRKAKDDSDDVTDEDGKRKKYHSVDESDQAMSCDSPLDLEAVPKSALSFRCPRCGKELQQTVNELADRDAALRKLKMEHEDFHFAQDLAGEYDGNRGSTGGSHSGIPKKVEKDEVKGIAKFFNPAPRKKM